MGQVFPLGQENLENGKAFSSEGKKKVIEKHTKYWKISDNTICFFSNICINSILFAKVDNVFSLKKTWKKF